MQHTKFSITRTVKKLFISSKKRKLLRRCRGQKISCTGFPSLTKDYFQVKVGSTLSSRVKFKDLFSFKGSSRKNRFYSVGGKGEDKDVTIEDSDDSCFHRRYNDVESLHQ